MKKLLVVLLLAAGCNKPPEAAAPPMVRKPKVTAAEAVRRDIESTVEAVGSIEALEEVSIPAQVSGVIDKLNFKEGDTVDTKTVLMEIDLERFKLIVAKIQAELDRATAQEQLTKTVYENRKTLYDEGKQQKKEWVTDEQLATWKADFDKATADRMRSDAELSLAKRDLAHATVQSPIPGIINGKLVSQGEFVKAETVVAKIINISTLHIRFAVPELEASRLKLNQEITFTVRSAPETVFKAKLFHMGQKADMATRSVECKAEVVAKSAALRAGTYASVKVVTGRKSSVVVPDRSVLPTDKGFVVYVLDGDRVKSRPVKIGLRVEGGIELLDGLEGGEKVVVDGAASLRDGIAVDVVAGSPS